LAITKERKNELVEQYVGLLKDSQAVVFLTARGLSVAQVTQLRTQMREMGSRYHVIKNTLFRHALTQLDRPAPASIKGPLGAVFCMEDIAPTIKAIQDYAKALGEESEFSFVGGLVDRDVLDAAGAEALASVPSKEELYVKVLVSMQSPATRLVGQLKAPANQLVGVMANAVRPILGLLQARIDQLEKGAAA
jgi:large subunit ribosomal protein L10